MKKLFVLLFFVVFILRGPNPANAAPLAFTGAIHIDVSNGSGIFSGIVSSGHQIFEFGAVAGDLITLDIDVTGVFWGSQFRDDDSELFLFNGSGGLVAENDDFDGLQSKIEDFQASYSGTYYVGVTTYDNNPIFDADGIIIAWEDDGASCIEFDLIIEGVTPTTHIHSAPEPITGLTLAAGLVGLPYLRTSSCRRQSHSR